jgi:hypothetical protein
VQTRDDDDDDIVKKICLHLCYGLSRALTLGNRTLAYRSRQLFMSKDACK